MARDEGVLTAGVLDRCRSVPLPKRFAAVRQRRPAIPVIEPPHSLRVGVGGKTLVRVG
ncbi:hypothetical protein [Streptomyces sp. NPDC087862]|uniref:hypothetical protein n=1 Tax=Streptomyces sp. NPDC087862 TaxID=3365813 RepID=UPI00380F43B8